MKKILDLGCGAGNLLNYLSRKNKKSLLFGIDIEKKIIERAEKNKFCNREKFILTDGKKLPFEKDFFDEVYCYEVLEHVENLDEILLEIKRVLKDKGKLKITVPLEKSEKILLKYNPAYLKQIGHVRFFSKDKLKKILEEKEFKIISHKTGNSIEHLYWKHVFKRGGKIINQLGEVDKKASKWMRVSVLALSRDILYNISQTKNKNYKVIMNFFFILYPIILLMDYLLINKKQKMVVINEK